MKNNTNEDDAKDSERHDHHVNVNRPSCGGRILIVDDDSDVLFTLRTVLHHAGYTVEAYGDPTRALNEYFPEKYDVMLIDVKMPEISGFDLYKNIRTKDQKARVCFLTAGETYYSEFVRIFPELSEYNYLMKPVENERLLERILKIISSENTAK